MAVESYATQLCAKYLSGAWHSAAADTFTMTEISGGLTSKLYRCRLSLPPVDSEPTDVLFRVHGEVLLASSDILLNNTIVTALLAERGLGPKLYAVFPGGRIEEFVQSVPED
jgi:choline/ethanolamine kinase